MYTTHTTHTHARTHAHAHTHTHTRTHTHTHTHTQVEVKGYNHKQSILLSKIMNKLANFKVDPKKFAIYHEIIRRKLRNFQAEQPHRHAIYYTSILLDSQMWSTEDLAEALEGESPVCENCGRL